MQLLQLFEQHRLMLLHVAGESSATGASFNTCDCCPATGTTNMVVQEQQKLGN